MVVRTLQPTVRGLAMAGHLSTKAEAKFYTKYSEKDDFIPEALLAPNRCYTAFFLAIITVCSSESVSLVYLTLLIEMSVKFDFFRF